MKHLLLPLTLLLLVLPASAEPASWVSFDVPAAEEEGALAVLAHRNLDAIAWPNAVAEVSDFGPLRLLPVKDLDKVLTPEDPRRDPWLAGIAASFRPREGTGRIWVAAETRDQAAEALGARGQDSGHSAEVAHQAPAAEAHGGGSLFTPRQVTAWTLLIGSLLFLVLRLAAALLSGAGLSAWKSVLLPAAGLVVAAALLLLPAGAVRAAAAVEGPRAAAEVSWLRHRWFQEAYPWGAGWKDWAPGKAWTYPSYVRQDGRLVAAPVSLPAADQAWADAAYASLDPHHAARIFPRENP